jgi:PAS domain S-box-containing protein
MKVSEFFRDDDLHAELRDRVLPLLVAEARTSGELRIWSAGCATGEEAYSLAILVLEAMGGAAEDISIRVFGTDPDSGAIDFARRGVYPSSALEGMDDAILERYFVPVDGAYEVRVPVRAATVFGQHDLGQRAPFPRIDLVLCRNVLIHFTPELQRRAMQLFASSLRDGGRLVLGKAETPGDLGDTFVLEDGRLKIYRRQGQRVAIPPPGIGPAASEPLPHALETLDEELQAMNEELDATNAELEARSRDLHALTRILEAEKQAIETQSARLRAVLEAIDDAVLVVAADGTVTLSNPAAEQMFGRGATRLRAEDERAMPLPDAAQPMARIRRGEAFELGFTAHDEDGARRWYEATGRPLGGGASETGLLIIHDVSERTLRHMQERFIAMAGHELRTPLTAVRGYLALLRRRLALEDGDPREELMRETAGQVERLGDLVGELFDASRLRAERVALETRAVDLVDLTETAVATARALGDGREIRASLPDTPLPVSADRRRLEQAVLNLLLNALRHAPNSPIEVTIDSDDDAISLSVADHGPGIPAERQATLFEPFGESDQARRRGGLGLGLFIARGIVEAHDGTISVSSAPGRGAVFTIRLPAPRRAREPRSAPRSRAAVEDPV